MILNRLIIILSLLNFFTPSFAATSRDSHGCLPAECLGGIAMDEAEFLLAAPDRGYAGNQKVRMAFSEFERKHNAELVFVTDKRMEPYLHRER